ncbi:SDR family NAD(P)-dependent oxidoreductase [Pseudonocardia sp. DLS-67]
MSDIWDDPDFTTGDQDGHTAHGQSKTANILFAVELDRRWADQGIHGYAVHPGIVVGTNLGGWMSEEQLRAANLSMGLIDESGRPIIDPYHEKTTPLQGASTIVFAATSPLLAGIGGVHLQDNDISPLDADPKPVDLASGETPISTVVPHAVDPESAKRLRELSERLLAA